MNEIFQLVMDLASKEDIMPIKDRIWTYKVDEQWLFKVNGHTTATEEIPAFHIYVEYNGFPAGLIGIDGGVIAAGEAANEESFIEALRKRLDPNA